MALGYKFVKLTLMFGFKKKDANKNSFIKANQLLNSIMILKQFIANKRTEISVVLTQLEGTSL